MSNGDFVDVYRPRVLHIAYAENNGQSPLESAVILLATRCKVEGQLRNAAYYLNMYPADFIELQKLISKT